MKIINSLCLFEIYIIVFIITVTLIVKIEQRCICGEPHPEPSVIVALDPKFPQLMDGV